MTREADDATAVAMRFFGRCGAGAYEEAASLFAPDVLASERRAIEMEFEPPQPFETFRENRADLSEDDARVQHAAMVKRFTERAPFVIAGARTREDLADLSDMEVLARRLEAIDPASHYRHDYRTARARYPEYEQQLTEKIEQTAQWWDFEHVGTLVADTGRAYVLYFPPFERGIASDAYDPEPHQVVLRSSESGWYITRVPTPHARVLKRRGLPVRVMNARGEEVTLPVEGTT